MGRRVSHMSFPALPHPLLLLSSMTSPMHSLKPCPTLPSLTPGLSAPAHHVWSHPSLTAPPPGLAQSVWVKTGTLQWWCDWKPHKWVDVSVALEQFTGLDGARDSILFIYYVLHEEKKVRGVLERGTLDLHLGSTTPAGRLPTRWCSRDLRPLAPNSLSMPSPPPCQHHGPSPA